MFIRQNKYGYGYADIRSVFGPDSALHDGLPVGELRLDLYLTHELDGSGYASQVQVGPGQQVRSETVTPNYSHPRDDSSRINHIHQVLLAVSVRLMKLNLQECHNHKYIPNPSIFVRI